jgi:hypothetical protein
MNARAPRHPLATPAPSCSHPYPERGFTRYAEHMGETHRHEAQIYQLRAITFESRRSMTIYIRASNAGIQISGTGMRGNSPHSTPLTYRSGPTLRIALLKLRPTLCALENIALNSYVRYRTQLLVFIILNYTCRTFEAFDSTSVIDLSKLEEWLRRRS